MSHWAIRVIGSHEPGEDGHPGRSRSSIELVRRSPIRFIGIPKRCELGRNGTFWDTKGAGGRSKTDSHRFANMRTCALTHGLWTGCQCPVDQSGGERECISNAGYYSEQVNEPRSGYNTFALSGVRRFLPTVIHHYTRSVKFPI